MNLVALHKKHPRSSSVLIMLILPFAFVKVAVAEAPWDELLEGYRELWKALITGVPSR